MSLASKTLIQKHAVHIYETLLTCQICWFDQHTSWCGHLTIYASGNHNFAIANTSLVLVCCRISCFCVEAKRKKKDSQYFYKMPILIWLCRMQSLFWLENNICTDIFNSLKSSKRSSLSENIDIPVWTTVFILEISSLLS